ncbi:MAG: hypothetical protein ACXWC7_20225, partial [Chitinophagaceae bacterium]
MTKFYLLLIATVLFFSCKSVSKSYNKGNYTDAVEIGVKKLQKDPNDLETRDLVKSAYVYAVNQHEENIRNFSGSNNDNRYESILKEYNKLQDLYNAIHQVPGLANVINPTNYSDYVQTYRDKAADQHLDIAERWMEQGTKQAFRNAYNEHKYALRFRDNIAIKAKRDEAYNAAITKILVVPIQNYGSYSYHSSYQLQRFQDAVIRSLANNMSNDFVKFFTEWELRNDNTEPDQVLEMNLGRIRIGQPIDQRNRREVSKQVVIKEIVYKPDSVVKEYGTVRATITTTKRTLLSEGDLYLSMKDPRGRMLWNDRFTGQHRWQTEFTNYTGDERALSESDKALINKNTNQNPPREDDIMEELYRQIQNDLSYRLRNYFSRIY